MPQKGERSKAQKAKKAQRSSRKQKKKSKKRTSYQVNVSQVTTCEICQAENQIGEWFVACDTCGYDFHIDCVGQNNVDEGKPWFCTNCIENTSQLDINQEENEVSEPSVINVSDVTRSNVNTSNEVEPASQEKANVDNNDQSKSINTQPFGINIPVSVHRSADAWLQDLGNDDQPDILNPSYNRKRSTSVTGISNPNQRMKGLQNGNTIAIEKLDQTSIAKSTNASNAKENQSRSTPIGGTAERSTIELPGAILESNVRKSSLKSASRTSKQSASTTLQRIQDEFELQEKIEEEILSTQLEAIKRKEARYKKFLADVYDAKSHDGSVKSRASKVTSKTSYVSSWVEDQQKRSKLPDAEKSENVNKCYTNSFNVSIPVSKEELAMLRQSRIDEIRQNRIDDIFSKADKEERNKTSHSQSAKSNIGAEIIDDQMVARSYQNYTSTIVQPPVSRSTLLPKQQIISEKSTETVIESKIHNVRSGPAYPAGNYGADEIIHEEPIRDRTAFMKKRVQLSEQPTMKQTYQEMFPTPSDANVSTYRPTQQSQYHSSKPIYTSATRTQPTYSSTNNQQQYNTSEPPIYRSIGRMAYVPNSEQRYSGIGQPVEHTGNQTRAEPFDGRNTRYKIQHDQTQLTPNQIAARHAIDKTLPKFDGNSYDWPHFIKRYENSTRICGLTDDENLERLNKCLMSPAKDIVRSQLMMPECVGEIMQILFERFGRPELVMNATLAAIREEPPIKPHQLNALANYGYKVHSACNVIERLGLHYYLYNPELVQEVLAKLPHQTKIDFAVCCHKVDQITLRTLGDWLRALSQTINRIAPAEIANNSVDRKGWKEKHSSERSSNDRKQDRNTDSSKNGYLNVHDGSKTSTREESKQNCVVCDKSCKSPAECSKFKTSDVEQRWESIKTHKLCRMCLKRHTGRCKNAKDCGTNGCTFKHHAMLHNETRHSKDSTQQLKRSNKQDSKPAVTNKSDSDEGKKEVKSGSSNTHFQQEEEIFRISPVVLHYNNKSVKTYAYFDEGSSFTLLERETASQLDVRGTSETICLLWTNKVHRQEESEVVDIDISGNIYDTGEIKPTKKHHMKSVYIVDELGLPSQSLEVEKLRKRFAHLKNVPLIGYENIVPTMLIGLKHVKLTVPLEVVEGVDGEPIATRSRLGWQVYGPGGGCTKGFVNTHRVKKCPCQDRDDEIHKLVKDHFTIENFGVSSTPASTNSKEDEKALKMLQELTMRKGDRFQTGLLWKNNVYKLPDSYPMAKKRLICLENKGQKAIDTINESIEDYLQKGYVTKLSTSEADITSNRTWYLPIFTAVNPKKPEKLRTVFDAAAKVKGVSLNAVLFTGPDLLVSIVDVLRRFREHRIAINGDVKEMYHQVLINDQDRDSQRFLWRNGDKSKEPETYQMNVMTFGSTCSPSTAQYVKNLNASEFLDKYPRAVEAIIKNHYVDDMMDGTDSIEETIQLVNDVKFIHRKGGFEIRNFKSNSPEVLKAIGEPFNDEMIAVDNINLERVLGMFWETKSDCLTFSLKYTKVTTDVLIGKKLPTKRELLKLLMSIYDPLGLLSYYLIHLKILLQDVWRSDIGWDTPLPSHLKVAWKRWITILPEVEKIRIPRWYSDKLSPKVTKEVELHVFVDAGDHAYSAVAYLRIVSDEGVAVVLIGSKARVTPLKYLSIPRKELLASLLGTRLSNNIKEGLSTKIHRRIIWSDSITVLTWLHSEHQKYSQFVAHRVGEILETTELCEWRWVPSKQNVADEATKWSKTPTFESTNRWFQGPEFLQLPEPNWPQLPEKIIPNGTEEEMKLSFSHSKLIMPTVINTKRFSVWERMLRAVAYAIRWGRIMLAKVRKLEKPKGKTQEELLAAEKLLFRQAQWEGFTEEMITLVNNKKNPTKQKSIEKSSIIYDCQPYLDQFGVMRVKGRIDNATMLELDTRRPIILPRNNHITKLIMLSYHVCLMHQNHETAINEIKQRFYIPRIRVAFRSARWNCGACAVRRSLPRPPQMADLPSIRFEPVRAFTYAGIDYFGPIRVMVGRRVEKRWGVLITCLTIRAIHIEVVHSLDTDSCIKALRRFISLRGRPTEIYSDNGTSFKGADKELKEELKKLDVVELSSSYKSCLKVSMTARIPKDETLDTLLKEIMNIVNSRPLTFVPLDSCDAEALTPNHFILGSSNGLKPPGKFKNDGPYLRSAWREVQRCTNIFWQRFINEYVPTLTRRTKWFDKVKPIEVGDIVLDFDENSPRNTYRRARVVDTKIGSNEQVRRVRVQYADGKILWRSAVKLGVLDVHPAPTVDSSLDHQSMIETEGNNVGARNSNVETTSGPSVPISSTPASSARRLSTTGSQQPPAVRDNKLMLVLAARRQALMRDRHRPYTIPDSTSSASSTTFQAVQSPNEKLTPRRECEKNCTSNFTARASAGCMRKCAILFKVENNGTETSRRNIEALNSRIRVGEKEFNTIAEELLETEESQSNGLYHVHPRSRYAPNVPETKDANSTNSNKTNYKQSNVIENEVRQTSTEKVYTKFVRTTTDGRHKRIDPTIVKHRTISTEKLSTSEESDILPYSIFGQKIATSKQNESKNLVTTSPRRSSIIDSSSRPTSKLSDEEVMEFSVSKVPAYERNKFRRINPTHRNIVAMTRKIQNGNVPHVGSDVGSTILRSRIPEGLIATNSSIEPRSEGSTVFENVSVLNTTSVTNETLSSTAEPILEISKSTSTTTTTTTSTPSTTSTSPDTSTSTSTSTTESIRNIRSSTEISVIETTNAPEQEKKSTDPLHIYVPDPEPSTPSTTVTSDKITSPQRIPDDTIQTTSEKMQENVLLTTPVTPLNLPDSMIKPRINDHREEPRNLIVFYKPNATSDESKTESPTKSKSEDDERDFSSSTTKSFTRTTVSSSVRSTVNPIVKNHSTVDNPMDVSTSSSTESNAFSNMNTSMIYQNLSDLLKPTKKSSAVSDGPFLTNNDVTIEMHRMNMATYVLAALGMFPVILIVLYIAKTIIFRRDDKASCDLERYIISDSQKQISPVVKLDRSDHQIYSDESIMTEHSFRRNFLKFKNLLGEGNFGQVWKAEADDLAGHLGTTRIVAVKTERCVNGGLRDEAAIMRKLGSHSNVVTLLGACVEKEPHLLIMEFAMRGRLLSLLRAAKTALNNSHNGAMGPRNFAPLSPRRLTGFAHDIARGMEYISEKKIVHRDLATRNVLLDHNGVCKICDFGMSIDLELTKSTHTRKIDLLRQQSSPESNRFRFEFHRRSFGHDRKADHCAKRPALPIRWMAPEALQYHIFTTETDMWAFGIVLWEIASGGCTPYPTLSGLEVVRNVPNGTRPDIPSDCRPELYELMSRAWRKDPRQRPTFKEARSELARALCQWEVDDNTSDYLDVSGFSEDLEHGMVYFNRRISEFECEI